MKQCPACLTNFTPRGYCRSCANAYMREWRKSHPMTAEQRFRDSARSYLGVYVRRGKVAKHSECQSCGGGPTEAHHHNGYDKPLDVIWLCRSCHMATHSAKIPAPSSDRPDPRG